MLTTATYVGPPRAYGGQYPKRYICWHNTANTAPPINEANYARNRTDGTSSHFYCDPNVVLQSLDTAYGANHVGSAAGNRHAVAIEVTGNNSYSADYWRRCIDRIAPVVAQAMRHHGIPNRWATLDEMRAGTGPGGHITHDMARLAWGGTNHTDPGPNFPKPYVLDAVGRVLNPAPPPPPQEDDMGSNHSGQLPAAFAGDEAGNVTDKALMAVIPIDPGPGRAPHVSLACDMGAARVRVAVKADGGNWSVRTVNIDSGMGRVRVVGPDEIPGGGLVTLARCRRSATDTDDKVPVGWVVNVAAA